MLAASAAWDALADNLYSTATAYGSAISDLDVVVARALVGIDGGRGRPLRVVDNRHRRAG